MGFARTPQGFYGRTLFVSAVVGRAWALGSPIVRKSRSVGMGRFFKRRRRRPCGDRLQHGAHLLARPHAVSIHMGEPRVTARELGARLLGRRGDGFSTTRPAL